MRREGPNKKRAVPPGTRHDCYLLAQRRANSQRASADQPRSQPSLTSSISCAAQAQSLSTERCRLSRCRQGYAYKRADRRAHFRFHDGRKTRSKRVMTNRT
jgi:hypothetical protein